VKRTVRSLDSGGERRTTTIVLQPRSAGREHQEGRPAAQAPSEESNVLMIAAGLACIWIGLTSALVTTVLGLRFSFLLADAGRRNDFVDFIYDLTRPLVAPFQDVVANRSLNNGGIVEPATLIAVTMYLLAAMLLVLFIWGLTATRPYVEHTNRSLAHGH
jgi:hypothetical protein